MVDGRTELILTPLPVLRLARLGVDTRAQGLGIGKALLRHVLALAVEGVREGLLHGEPLPMFLAIDTIASALEG